MGKVPRSILSVRKRGKRERERERSNLQFNVSPLTGNSYGENSTATTHAFQKTPMNWNGLLHRPRLHRGFGNRFGVSTSRHRQMRPYAAAEGTPAAEMSDVKATMEGRMVQVTRAATAQTTTTALRGWPCSETRETQPEKGSTPSRATAKTRREAATMAMAVFL